LAKIYFKEIRVFGLENVPRDKPLIISCNHNSQFVDALLLVVSIPRSVSFIIAASSTTHPFLRYFLKLVHVIPTVRPMDVRKKGKGKIVSSKDGRVIGEKTAFLSEINAGDSIKFGILESEVLVSKVISDTELIINIESSKLLNQTSKDQSQEESNTNEKTNYNNQVLEASKLSVAKSNSLSLLLIKEDCDLFSEPLEFDIYPKLNQEMVYSKAVEVLGNRSALGIFPEGGSHDKTELLPLKAGACIFLWSVKEKQDVDAFLQCIGINYFGAHKFRSKVVINVGKLQSFDIDKSQMKDREYKRRFISSALEELKVGMETVKVSAPTLREMLNLYTAKEIVLKGDSNLDAKMDFELFRKFCSGYKKIKDFDDIKILNDNIYSFRSILKANGLKVCDIRNYRETFRADFKPLAGRILLLGLLVTLLDPSFFYFLLAHSIFHQQNC
jgi:glycerol-3-phosphate O-acyltransferase/dihydroxyacetone phosphate acyltransferase